jgi:hypothetical protein
VVGTSRARSTTRAGSKPLKQSCNLIQRTKETGTT